MKLTSIRVTKLFGIFDHTIPLNTNEHITIIHGSNGLGKTTLLNMIEHFFNHNFFKLSMIPFHEFIVQFDDKSSVFLINKTVLKPNEKRKSDNNITILYKPINGKTQNYVPDLDLDEREFSYPIHMIEDIVPGISQTGPRTWRNMSTGELLNLNDILHRYSEYFPSIFSKHKNIPDWLIEIKKHNPIRFIRTERLLNREVDRRSPDKRNSENHSVSIYANELARDIKSRLADYGALSQSLDRTFPARLVRLKPDDELENQMLLDKLDELEIKRKKLIELGVLDNNTDLEFRVSNEEIDDRTRSVLSIYVRDTEEKLNVFNDLAARIDLLKRIIKARFRNKEMLISKENGINFVTSAGEQLHPMSLSSGEQHQIVLLYELLFKITEDSLILIDEPELSLHVAWQVKFLRDLQQITSVVPFDVLIATHSPQIINDRWDLTVALQDEGDLAEEEDLTENEFDNLDRLMEGIFK